MRITKHARTRAQQRGIPEPNLHLIHAYCSGFDAYDGAIRYVLTNKDCDEQKDSCCMLKM